jgi:hypothetical protein
MTLLVALGCYSDSYIAAGQHVFELEHDARLESRTQIKAHNLTIAMPKSVYVHAYEELNARLGCQISKHGARRRQAAI